MQGTGRGTTRLCCVEISDSKASRDYITTDFTPTHLSQQERQATLSRVNQTSAPLKIGTNLTLDILVENMGRINYGPHLQDPKGILGSVTLGEMTLENWHMFPLNLDNVVGRSCTGSFSSGEDIIQPALYEGDIPPAPDGVPRDTFMRLKGWTKVRP